MVINMLYTGIDVSKHNGKIDWAKVKSQIDFAIIRGGYGKNHIDERAVYNFTECQKNKIPFGIYWFSYALTEAQAKEEAKFVCDLADKYKPDYPICYDWEYDSDKNAKANNVTMTNEKRKRFAEAFLKVVKDRGYIPCLYSNVDYLNKGFQSLVNKYDFWLAHWGVNKPSRDCQIWQTSSSGKYNGISGHVDTDVSYKDYTKKEDKKEQEKEKETQQEKLDKLEKEFWSDYVKLANEIIAGKWGNGDTRKKNLQAKGYDYSVAQAIVNVLVK